MVWNYRAIRTEYRHNDGHVEYSYSIHEVFYEDDGSIMGWTESPVCAVSGTAAEVIEVLDMMKRDCKRLPVVREDKANKTLVPVEVDEDPKGG